ncbi:hypothetical protein [Dokdonia sinensis]|nr:hypothetical protein [Dokdonia sinensis]
MSAKYVTSEIKGDSSITIIQKAKDYVTAQTIFDDGNKFNLEFFLFDSEIARISIIDNCTSDTAGYYDYIICDDDIWHKSYSHSINGCNIFKDAEKYSDNHYNWKDVQLFSLNLFEKIKPNKQDSRLRGN